MSGWSITWDPLLTGSFFFFFNPTAPTEIYTVGNTLSLHDALPIWSSHSEMSKVRQSALQPRTVPPTRPRSEEHTSELQSLPTISYAVFCLKKKKNREDKTLSHISTIRLNSK